MTFLISWFISVTSSDMIKKGEEFGRSVLYYMTLDIILDRVNQTDRINKKGEEYGKFVFYDVLGCNIGQGKPNW